jgi:hypothetical protein
MFAAAQQVLYGEKAVYLFHFYPPWALAMVLSRTISPVYDRNHVSGKGGVCPWLGGQPAHPIGQICSQNARRSLAMVNLKTKLTISSRKQST